jgi:hypothetical protein
MSRATPSKAAKSTKAPPAAPGKAPTMSAQQPIVTQEKIAKLAYEKWCSRGMPHGSSMHDWLEAEKELMTECKSGKK